MKIKGDEIEFTVDEEIYYSERGSLTVNELMNQWEELWFRFKRESAPWGYDIGRNSDVEYAANCLSQEIENGIRKLRFEMEDLAPQQAADLACETAMKLMALRHMLEVPYGKGRPENPLWAFIRQAYDKDKSQKQQQLISVARVEMKQATGKETNVTDEYFLKKFRSMVKNR